MPTTARDLHLLGISFRTASETVREGLAFSPSQVVELLEHAKRELPDVEAVAVSTCNRTEFYLAGAGTSLQQQWHAVLRGLRPDAPALDEDCARYHLTGADAYRHLLRVVCGLDSALLGDGQILGQVRRSVALAQQAGTLGGLLSPAFAAALRAGRQVRAETDIGLGAPGVGSAVAAALTSRALPSETEVLLLGTGHAARTISRALVKSGYRRLVVSGRNPEAAAKVADECGGTTATWAERDGALRSARVVVVATAASSPVLTALPPGSAAALVVDAGFPRQVTLPPGGVEVVSLLTLTQQADAAAEQRRAAVPVVEGLIAEHVATWQLGRDRAPLEEAIKALHTDAAQVTREAAQQLSAQAGLSPEDIERLLAPQVRRMLHGHVTRLRSLQG